jgi:Biotin-lipoyl like
MIVALFNVYLVLLFFLVKFKIVPFNLFWKVSPLLVLLFLMFGLFIPMGWGAPQGPAMVVRNSVAIVPDVAGEVTDVPVSPNKPLKAGNVLFKIDPTPYQAQVDTIAAQLKFEELRLAQMTQLQLSDAGRAFDVQQRQADVDKLKGQLRRRQVEPREDSPARAGRRLRHQCRADEGRPRRKPATVSRDGFHRHIRDGDRRRNPADLHAVHRAGPGGRSHTQVLPRPGVHGQSRVRAGGDVRRPSPRHGNCCHNWKQVTAAPFVVRVKLDDDKLAASLPAGTAGDGAIYTPHIKPSHIIRKVILRQIAIVNYVNPF